MPIERFVAVQWLIILAAFAWLIFLLEPILTPFVAGAILAYICNPLVSRLSEFRLPGNRNLPRTLSVVLVLLALLAVVTILVLIMLPMLQREFSHFISRMPLLLDTVRLKLLPILQEHLGMEVQWDNEMLKELLNSHWQNAGGAAAKVLPWLGGGGAFVLTLLLNVLLTPLVLFFLLRDWSRITEKLDNVVPRGMYEKFMQIAREIDSILAEFLRGQISVMLLMSAFYVTGLWIAGLQFALPIGVVTGVLVFIPYVGVLAGILLATLTALMQFDQLGSFALIWAVFAVGHVLEGTVITPWLVGDRIGLHPLAVIFALLAFGQLFGFFGLLLALPLSAALLVGLRHAIKWYLQSSLYKG